MLASLGSRDTERRHAIEHGHRCATSGLLCTESKVSPQTCQLWWQHTAAMHINMTDGASLIRHVCKAGNIGQPLQLDAQSQSCPPPPSRALAQESVQAQPHILSTALCWCQNTTFVSCAPHHNYVRIHPSVHNCCHPTIQRSLKHRCVPGHATLLQASSTF